MISTTNRPLNAPPNRLSGESQPNTLGGIGLRTPASPLRRTWPPAIALAGAIGAAVALVVLLWQPA